MPNKQLHDHLERHLGVLLEVESFLNDALTGCDAPLTKELSRLITNVQEARDYLHEVLIAPCDPDAKLHLNNTVITRVLVPLATVGVFLCGVNVGAQRNATTDTAQLYLGLCECISVISTMDIAAHIPTE